MKGVIKTVRIADIELLLHWTFPAFLAFVALVQLLSGDPGEQIFVSALFILILFICIVLHELGHAAAARYFGVETESIILLPVGGVATLERAPENPLQELIISVSGPLVNAVIAGFLAAILAATGMRTGIEDDFNLLGPATFLRNLMRVNLILAVFNLIPAFPMDGGRILRAILSTDSPVEHLYEKMQAGGPEILPVFGQSGLVGAVDMENIQEYVMIRLAGLKRGQ